MLTYLRRLTDERDSLTQSATDLADHAATEERDLTDTERASLTSWQTAMRGDRRAAHRIQRASRVPARIRAASRLNGTAR
jgi:hypothetical protein